MNIFYKCDGFTENGILKSLFCNSEMGNDHIFYRLNFYKLDVDIRNLSFKNITRNVNEISNKKKKNHAGITKAILNIKISVMCCFVLVYWGPSSKNIWFQKWDENHTGRFCIRELWFSCCCRLPIIHWVLRHCFECNKDCWKAERVYNRPTCK